MMSWLLGRRSPAGPRYRSGGAAEYTCRFPRQPRGVFPAMPPRIHITGASCAGTTTLGLALAARLGCDQFDSDDFFWVPTDPPFNQRRPPEERLRLLRPELETRSTWVLSGSLANWGNPLIPHFTLVVFLWIPGALRMRRLKQREIDRYGAAALGPGGAMHQKHLEFLAWAAQYDTAGPEMRSRVKHEAWLATLPCPVVRLEGDQSVEDRVAAVLRAIAEPPDGAAVKPRGG